MTNRIWNGGDPEPADCTAVVDDEGNVWLRVEDPWQDGSDGHYGWVRQRWEHHSGKAGSPGVVVGGMVEDEWADLLATYGPLRRATSIEAREVRVVIQ